MIHSCIIQARLKELVIGSRRRAIAPIISGLLMVAIAVVGGILIFVFTQGFFADEQVIGPTVDNVRIFGFDSSNTSDIEGYSGDTITCTGSDTNASTLANGDCLTVYVENLGDKPVAFQEVTIFGESHSIGTASFEELFELFFVPIAFANGGASCASTAGDFILMTGTTSAEDNILEPNESGTLCIKYGGDTPVKIGRTIPIQIQTANGQSSQINVFNGVSRGQITATAAEEEGCTSAPGNPGLITLVDNGNTLTASWSAVDDGGCPESLVYNLYLSTDGGQTYPSTVFSGTSTSTPYNDCANHAEGVTIYFRLTPSNDFGAASNSAPILHVVACDV